MKETIVIINGGLSFRDHEQRLEHMRNIDIEVSYESKGWKDWIMWSLSDKYNFVKLKLVGQDYGADYESWKIIFEKYLDKLKREGVEKFSIIAHSLGTIFICKYLVENNLKVNDLHLVASIISNNFQPANDPEDTGTFTFDITKIKEVGNKCDNVILWHSTDDTICSIKNSEYIKEQIPTAQLFTFTDRFHFIGSTFLELFDYLCNR